jgi:hypothetical protein
MLRLSYIPQGMLVAYAAYLSSIKCILMFTEISDLDTKYLCLSTIK